MTIVRSASQALASLNVLDYGAVGDGTTDDTTAVQAAVTYAVTNSRELVFPARTYKITAAIVVAAGTHFSLLGTGALLSQATDNTPIFRFTKEDTAYFALRGFRFQWVSFQSSSNTSAIALAFDPDTNVGHGIYNFVLDRLTLVNGFSLMGLLQANTVSNPIWGFSANDIYGGVAVTGPVIKLDQPSGAPNINIHNFYARRDQGTTPAIHLRTATVQIDGFETNNATGNQLLLDSCEIDLHNLRVEVCSITTASTAVISLPTCTGTVSAVQFQTITFNQGAGNTSYFMSIAASSTVIVNGLALVGNTYTSGTTATMSCAGAATIELNGYTVSGTLPSTQYVADGSSSRVIRENNIFRRGVVHGQGIQTLGTAGAVTFNAQNGNLQRVTLNANATSSSISNPSAGQTITIEWIQGASGSFTYVWPTNCKFAGGTAPSASTTAAYHDSVTFYYDGTNWYETGRSVGAH